MKLYLLNSSPSSSLALLGLLAVLLVMASEQCTVNIVNNQGDDLTLLSFDGRDGVCLVEYMWGAVGPGGARPFSCSDSSASCQITGTYGAFC